MNADVSRPVPPPGPTLTFRSWAQHVHREIAVYVPDITASGNKQTVTMKHGSLSVQIVPDGAVWWVHFCRAGQFAMPPLSIERHDALTARSVAHTAIGFFDAAQSTPNKKPLGPATKKPDSNA